MRFLVLGGTAWVGRTITAEALSHGHEVVCLARGESGQVADGARLVVADRDRPGAYDAVDGRWDAVFDVARRREHVEGAVAALGADRYVLVSTGNVYADPATPHLDEGAAVLDPDGEPADGGEAYGMGKVACERAVLGRFGDRALIARAGLIGGPGDASGRSGYWPWRFAHPSGDASLVPAASARPAQLIDARDLAAWLVRGAEEGLGGVFNAAGEDGTLGAFLGTAMEVAGSRRIAEAPEAWLLEQGVAEWAGPRSLPLWLADPGWQGFAARDGSRARAAGLTHRPLGSTLADALAWEETRSVHPHGAGLTDAEELDLLRLLASGTGR